jgi:hypothetical protein
VTDVGDYCRQVEAYLTRVNGGHLVRIVGPGFSLVRDWAESGVPLSAVFRGIDQKAERHARGTSKRPLRIEFCEADVRDVYDTWRQAIGLTSGQDAPTDRGSGSARRAGTRDLDRAVERLVAVAGQLAWPESFRAAVNATLDQVASARDGLARTRGEARTEVLRPLATLDRALLDAAREALPTTELAKLKAEAEQDLAAYQGRMTADAWTRAVEVTIDRLVRTHVGLPDLAGIAGVDV